MEAPLASQPTAPGPGDEAAPRQAQREPAPSSADSGRPARHGVVFVHGVGEQRKSDTLLDFGGPVLRFLQRWHQAREATGPVLQAVNLSFAPVDVGRTDEQSAALLNVGLDTWVLTEAWWATSNRRPGLGTMLRWSWAYLAGFPASLQRYYYPPVR